MKKSLRLGRIAGIDLFVHWTFGLLLLGIPAYYLFTGSTVAGAFFGLGLILAVFGCVVLHELGHALAARRYGVPTRDITLYPIGGVARLERIPEEPMKEFWIAIAGPAVNVAIAAVLFVVIGLFGGFPPLVEIGSEPGTHFLAQLMWLNVVLVLFNLLPAFPMDGGRVLRALLATRLNYARATQIAAKTGQGMAILFGVLGFLYFNPILMFVALFVYLGAQQEEKATMIRSIIQGIPIRQAMMTHFQTLSPAMTLNDAVAKLLDGSDQDFPVVEEGRVVGLLTRKQLMQALAAQGHEVPVRDVMQTSCPEVKDTAMLEEAFQHMQEASCPMVPVTKAGRLIGVLTLENVGELMMIASVTNRTAGVAA